MTNWTLNNRESALLIDVSRESRSRKQSVADINAHELAHQWFGNLVSWLIIYFKYYMNN